MVKLLFLAILWAATLVLATLYLRRSEYPYPDSGRYFDYDTGSMYDEDSLVAIGMLVILLSLVTVACTFLFVRGRIKKHKSPTGLSLAKRNLNQTNKKQDFIR